MRCFSIVCVSTLFTVVNVSMTHEIQFFILNIFVDDIAKGAEWRPCLQCLHAATMIICMYFPFSPSSELIPIYLANNRKHTPNDWVQNEIHTEKLIQFSCFVFRFLQFFTPLSVAHTGTTAVFLCCTSQKNCIIFRIWKRTYTKQQKNVQTNEIE